MDDRILILDGPDLVPANKFLMNKVLLISSSVEFCFELIATEIDVGALTLDLHTNLAL
jgi:hypothetical protein